MKTTEISISVSHYDEDELKKSINDAFKMITDGYVEGYFEISPNGDKPFTENVSFEFCIKTIEYKK